MILVRIWKYWPMLLLPLFFCFCSENKTGEKNDIGRNESEDDTEGDDEQLQEGKEQGCLSKGAISAKNSRPWRVDQPRYRRKKAGRWRIYYPGRDTCKLPDIVSATGIEINIYSPDMHYRDTCGFEEWRSNENLFLLKGLRLSEIQCMLHDSKGNYWFGDFGNGIVKFDGQFFSSWRLMDSLAGQNIWAICEDKAGNIWFAMGEKGLMKFDGKKCKHYNENCGLPKANVNSVFCDKKGFIWIGTADAGLIKFDGKRFFLYSTKQGLVDNNIECVTADNNGNLLIGTAGGLSRFNGIRFANLTPEEGLFFRGIGKVLQDKSGNLWIAANGFIKFDGIYFTYYDENDYEDDYWNWVLDMEFDKEGNLWMGHSYSSIKKFDGENLYTWHTGRWMADQEACQVIYKDRNQNLWFAADQIGALRFAVRDSVRKKQTGKKTQSAK